MEIIFRQLKENVPDSWLAGAHWVVEAYSETSDLPFPIGQAWVSDYQATNLTSLDFMLTADQYRQQGVGRALYKAIMERWPNIMVTDPISVSGTRFLDKMEPWRVKARDRERDAAYKKVLKKRKRDERQRKK